MAIYYVDYANGSDSAAGSSGAPWKTPAKALTVVTNGDTVRFRGNKTNSATFYRAAWSAKVAGVTWENDTGHTPTWHGGYHTTEDNFSLTGTEPGDAGRSMISIRAHNVTLRGLRVQHVGGSGISVSTINGSDTIGSENVLITQCESDYTYGAAIILKTPNKNYRVQGAEISHCTFTGMGFGKHDPDKATGEAGADAVQGSIQLLHCEDTHFHHNLVAYGCGEGINVGRGSTRSIVEYNTVHTMDHIHIAVVRCVECDVRYNVVYHTKHPFFMGGNGNPGKTPGGIRIGDESGTATMRSYPHSEKQRIYGNVVVGGSTCISVENGNRFDTQMKYAYIGYNTCIGERALSELEMPATQFVLDIQDRATGADHANSLVENNIFYAQAGAGLARTAGVGGVTFRNNAWYSADDDTAPTVAQSGTDVTADPLLTDPLKRFIDAYPNPATAATGLAFDNYRLLRGSPLIGAASNRAAVNGITPPTITVDLAGGSRSDLDRSDSEYYDIGALEYGATAPTDDVDADFTQSATTGEAPLAVTFTDTSTEDGAASIDRRVWEFGDGNSIEGTLTAPYIYGAAGTFTPRLTVYDTALGLSSSKTGSTITVTAAPTADTPGVIDVVRQLLPGTVGTRTIAFNLRGHAPALVLLFFTRTTTLNTAADDAFVSIGAVTPTEQWAAAFCCNDGVDPSSTEKYLTRDACITTLNGGVFGGQAVRSSVGPDRLTIEVTSAFNGGLLTAVAFGGAQWRGRASDVFLSALNTSSALSPGFSPEFWLFGGTMARAWNTVETNADFILGMADNTSQVGYTWRSVHDQATTKLRSDIMSANAFRHPSGVGYTLLEPVTATLGVLGANFDTRVGWAALDIAGNTQVATGQYATPTATGIQSYTVGFQPTALLGIVSNNTQTDAPTTNGTAPESFSIIAADVGATYSVCVASDNGAAAANSKTMSSDGIKVIAPDGSTLLAGTVSFTDTGFDINWTTVQAAARYFNVTAFGETPDIAGPIPLFEADDTTPEDGVVQFTDLSNANGSAITEWQWTFGDGTSSAEQHPEHSYATPGVYSVSLTVTNANGAETITKTNYIHYALRAHWLLGPYESRPITRTSIDRIYGDDPEDAAYGFHEHALELDALELDAQPNSETTEEPARPGKGLIKLDWANRKITIVWPDGTTSDFSED